MYVQELNLNMAAQADPDASTAWIGFPPACKDNRLPQRQSEPVSIQWGGGERKEKLRAAERK